MAYAPVNTPVFSLASSARSSSLFRAESPRYCSTMDRRLSVVICGMSGGSGGGTKECVRPRRVDFEFHRAVASTNPRLVDRRIRHRSGGGLQSEPDVGPLA